MFSNFTEEARNIIVDAKIEMMDLKHPYVGSEHLLLAILKNKNNVSEKLKEYGLTYDKFKNELINIIGIGSKKSELLLFTPLLKRILETATLDSKEQGKDVEIENLFRALLEEGEGIAIRTMMGMNIDLEELDNFFMYHPYVKKNVTTLIDEIGIDLTQKALNNELDPVIGREKEIKRMLEILLRRSKNNPILIGEAGVGKTAIVEELSRLIAINEVPFNLKGKRIISVDTASLVAGTKYRGEFEDKIKKIITEVEENDDIILFIDEIHTLVGAGGAEGAIDASNIFKPALARGKLRVIGATTIDEYKKYIEKDRALDRRFQRVNVETPNSEQTKIILMNLKHIYEKHHSVKISEEIINLIVDLSEKYIYDRNEPDKAIDILDEVCASVSIKEDKNQKEYNLLKSKYNNIKKQKIEALTNNDYKKAYSFKETENNIANKINSIELNLHQKKCKRVTKEDVASIISIKTKIPIYELLSDNKKNIDNVIKNLKKNIVGQDNAILEVTNYFKKIKLGYKNNKCYSMLFVGPSGVGKTMLAKSFGSMLAPKVIKLDMSEYSESYSVSKIIGSPPGYVGYENYTNILEEIRTNPYSVLILDEIERAHPNVINLFFSILDEGKIKDASSKEIRFDNVCIIMTSNVGFDDIHVGFNKKETNNINTKLQEYFSIPFLNRIDKTIVFDNLNDKNIDKLISIKIEEVKNKYKDYNMSISNNIIKEIKEKADYQNYGARKLDKIIKDNLTSIIIDEILDNKKNIIIESLKKDTLV